ncbi:MAG TPA: hypothetical protein VMH28_14430 [Candidatus Acidoferrales bacterium]|nr:hypothetical protein [Candidatus Acidoferrales bacterium]
MAAQISLSIRLGPMVSLKITGQSCQELAHALEGYDDLNVRVNAMCGDLAERVYPEGLDLESLRDEEEGERIETEDEENQ